MQQIVDVDISDYSTLHSFQEVVLKLSEGMQKIFSPTEIPKTRVQYCRINISQPMFENLNSV